MINKAKLRYHLEINQISQDELANVLGINPTTLYRKMNGLNDFYRHEILLIKEKLDLSVNEMNDIFFN